MPRSDWRSRRGRWRTGSRRPNAAPLATPGARTVSELEAENSRLRKELAEARQERDILKKATAYFARESLPGTRS